MLLKKKAVRTAKIYYRQKICRYRNTENIFLQLGDTAGGLLLSLQGCQVYFLFWFVGSFLVCLCFVPVIVPIPF